VGRLPNEVTVHPRAIVKRALELSATALILVHNHPSGSPDPSQSDIQTTARIVRAAKTLDIVVHDHIIVAPLGQSGLSLSKPDRLRASAVGVADAAKPALRQAQGWRWVELPARDVSDVLAIGDAIVDVIATAEDDFLTREGLPKGSMRLIDAPRRRASTA
jgi:hypothetical protein